MLHGRDAERRVLDGLVEGARAGRAGALVVHGEPGVGKSALLAELLEGLSSDVRVLRTQGVESEAPLPHAALHRLLRPLLPLLDRLPPPQARALRMAFGLVDGEHVEPFLVALATLSALTEAAETAPVVCVVDDAHWLDSTSADALLFAARRLDADRVAMIFAARDGDVRAFTADGVPHLALAGLDDVAVRALLADTVSAPVAVEVADQLLELTGGNPLALLELPSGLTADQLNGTAPLVARQMSAGRVGEVFVDRYRHLPAGARTFVLVAATDDTGQLAVVQAAASALGANRRADGEAALQSGLLTVVDGQVRMRHPLVRSAVYQAEGVAEREAAHLALADVVGAAGDVDRRTWHRAAVVSMLDEAAGELASDLDGVAARAERRGAFVVAADAYERAAQLRPDDKETVRRLFGAARNAWACGHTSRASELLTRARPRADDPVTLADIDRLRGRVEVNVGSATTAHRIFTDAASAVAGHDQVRALEMAVAAAIAQGHGAGSGATLAASVIDVEPSADDPPRVACLKRMLVSTSLDLRGELAAAINELRAAQQFGRTLTDLDVLGNLGNAALHLGDDASHREFYELMLAAARAKGDAMAVLYALQRVAFSQLLAGRWSDLRSSSEEALSLSLSVGQRALSASPRGWLLLLSAFQGSDRYDEQLNELEALLASHPPPGILAHPIEHIARWARAVHAAAASDAVAAQHQFAHVELPTLGRMVAQDRVDAAIRAGDHDQARAWVNDVEDFAARAGWAWAHAAAAYGRARLGEADFSVAPAEVEAEFESSLEHHATSQRPYDEARVRLSYGEFLRRSQRRVDARTHLRAALQIFEDLGADPLVDRSTQELRATGETARKRDPSTLVQLTPMELKVAELVRQGMSNKEVAGEIWVSPRTVAFHLRNVFAKTGITSRGQLATLSLP